MLEPHIPPPACGTADAFAAPMEDRRRPPLVFVPGRRSSPTAQEGKKYLDFIQGWAVNCLGHCPTAIVSAIKSQAEQLLNCSPAYYNAPMIRLAELIARYSGLHRTFFTNSGAEAIEGAIKLARKWGQIHRGGAYEIVTMHHGFHGRTLAAMSASGKAQWEHLFEPKVRVPQSEAQRYRAGRASDHGQHSRCHARADPRGSRGVRRVGRFPPRPARADQAAWHPSDPR